MNDPLSNLYVNHNFFPLSVLSKDSDIDLIRRNGM